MLRHGAILLMEQEEAQEIPLPGADYSSTGTAQ
jgi:hypothetical protein